MIVQEAFSCVIDKIWIEEISNFIYDLSINTLILFKKKKKNSDTTSHSNLHFSI
jgi:hypothetical protein